MHTYNVQSANHIEIPQPRKQIKVICYVNTQQHKSFCKHKNSETLLQCIDTSISYTMTFKISDFEKKGKFQGHL